MAGVKPAPAWFPNWTGERCVIVASGPSAKDIDLASARGKARFIAINNSWRLAPWSDLLYACDFRWWKAYKGVPEFAGLKASQDSMIHSQEAWNIKRVVCERKTDALLMQQPGKIGWAGNSGFHCLNLAAQFGCKRIILVGFDLRLDKGVHWHGRHSKMNNPTPRNVERWRRAIDDAAPVLKQHGIEVLNCSPISALKNYPKVSFAEAMQMTAEGATPP